MRLKCLEYSYLSLFGAQLLFTSCFIQSMNSNKLLSFCSSLQPQIMLVSLPIKTLKSHIFSLVISTKWHIKLAINPKAQLLSIFSSNLFFFFFLLVINLQIKWLLHAQDDEHSVTKKNTEGYAQNRSDNVKSLIVLQCKTPSTRPIKRVLINNASNWIFDLSKSLIVWLFFSFQKIHIKHNGTTFQISRECLPN